MRSQIYNIDSKTFADYVKNSNTFTDILRKCNLENKGGNINTVKRRVKKENINIEHIRIGRNHNLGKVFTNQRITKQEAITNCFISNSKTKRGTIKLLLQRYKLKDYKCCNCGCENTWNNKPLSLQLDHINGINNDNRLENLRFLCPNCHSQTETFAGKIHKKRYFCDKCKTETSGYSNFCLKCSLICRGLNNRKVDRPSKETLEKEINENTMVSLGKKYGVSDNAVRKWCKNYCINL